MDKKTLAILLSGLGIGVGLVSLFTGGLLGLIFAMLIYYFGIGFLVTEFTNYSNDIIRWIYDLLGDN